MKNTHAQSLAQLSVKKRFKGKSKKQKSEIMKLVRKGGLRPTSN